MIRPVITRLAALAGARIKSYGRCEIAQLILPGKSVHVLVVEYFKSGIPGSPVDLFDYRLCSKRELRSINEKRVPDGFSRDNGLILIGSTPCGDLLALELRNAAVHVLSHELLWTPGASSRAPMSRSRILETAVGRFPDLPTFLNAWERRAREIIDGKRQFAKASRRDPNAKDAQGRAPLHHAALFGEEKKVQSLLNRGANVELEDDAGETPLFYACKCGSPRVARRLISAGAEVDHRNRELVTPLMWAVHFSKLACIKLLLKEGADAAARDRDKRRAIDRICPVFGTAQIRRILRNAMQKARTPRA